MEQPRVHPPPVSTLPTSAARATDRNKTERDHHGREAAGSLSADAPSGIRTRATTLKGWRPRPLVDGGGRARIAVEPQDKMGTPVLEGVNACPVMRGRTGEHPALVNRRLALLASGSFVVATDGTLIVGLLRRVAADLSASPSATGQSIAVFALAYAAGAPLLIVLTRRLRQDRVLLAALILFAGANLATALAQSLASLLAARVLAGASAGVFTPTAAALAAVGPGQRRGRALAFVVSGASAAAIVGVPLGTILGVYLGWRSAFFLVVAMTLALIVALAKGVDRSEGSPRLDSSAYPPRRRLLMTLMVTLLWAAGSFTFFTYFAVGFRQDRHPQLPRAARETSAPRPTQTSGGRARVGASRRPSAGPCRAPST